MSDNWLQKTDIDINDPKTFDLLNNLQANILKHHGRRYAWHVFLQFVPGKQSEVKRWISTRLAVGGYGSITSAFTQLKDVQTKHEFDEKGMGKYDGGLITCFMISSKGYKYLDFDPAIIAGKDNTFTTMSMGNKKMLQDPPLELWEPAFQVDIHAMILLADNSRRSLRARLRNIRKETQGFIRIISNEKGKILRNTNDRAIEHFGYEDGLSQPTFLANGEVTPKKNWNDKMPLGVVLTRDYGIDQDNCYGSFVVFRKLEQNVRKFYQQREELARLLFQSDNIKLAGALAMGRFENGTPVTGYTEESMEKFDKNDFDYADDASDTPKCPYHAHIRITNPRDKTVEQPHIVRRGITYDEIGRKKDLSDRPEHGVGLYFISYQRSISQFEIIQHWAAGGKVYLKYRGIDPIVGQGKQDHFPQEWPVKNGKGTELKTGNHLMHVVTMLGGEYFYAPSITFLAKLVTL